MTAPDFLPEWKSLQTQHGHRPTYRMFEGQKERCVPYPGGPRYFATSGEAVMAAKAYVKSIINSQIVGEAIDQKTELSEVEAWRAKKEQQAIAERQRVFGVSDKPKHVHGHKSGRMTVVAYGRIA